ncbi:transferase [Aureococcus anophagefferens]|nr:transferase [Aureococcus anophagefferens]
MGFVGALLAAGAAAVDFALPRRDAERQLPAFPFKAFSAAYVEESLARPVDWRARGAVTPCKSQEPRATAARSRRLCRASVLPASTFSNWTTVPASAGEDQLAAFVRHNGPCRSASTRAFKNLDDDHHITPDRCGNFTAIDHSLGIVGYNATADKGAYWIVKNSWGGGGPRLPRRAASAAATWRERRPRGTYGDPSFITTPSPPWASRADRAARVFGDGWKAKLDLRFFAPKEIANLLGFPATFAFPAAVATKARWAAVGNSLHVAAAAAVVAEALRDLG